MLPGSPNRGVFGGDGAYGEVKSAFDAIVNRARAEHDWSGRVTFAHPKIGWVRGTGLMGGNDPLVEVVERHGLTTYSTEDIATELLKLVSADHGLTTYSTEDIATELLKLVSAEAREQARTAPLDVDLTGGLGGAPIDIRALRAEAMADAALDEAAAEDAVAKARASIKALPSPHVPRQARVDLAEWQGVTARPEDQILIGSVGELGPGGSGRTRAEAELGIHSDGQVELSAGAVLELAWSMGLLSWADSPTPGWYDADGNLVTEEDIAQRYHYEVVAKSGVSPFADGMGADYRDGTEEEEDEVYLDLDVSLTVTTRAFADEYVKMD